MMEDDSCCSPCESYGDVTFDGLMAQLGSPTARKHQARAFDASVDSMLAEVDRLGEEMLRVERSRRLSEAEPPHAPFVDERALERYSPEELVARLRAAGPGMLVGPVYKAAQALVDEEDRLVKEGFVLVRVGDAPGVWRKAPSWDPLAAAIPLWDVLPDLPENRPVTSANPRVGLAVLARDSLAAFAAVPNSMAPAIDSMACGVRSAWGWSGTTPLRASIRTGLIAQHTAATGLALFGVGDLLDPIRLGVQLIVSVVIVLLMLGVDAVVDRKARPRCLSCLVRLKNDESLRCTSCDMLRPRLRRTCPSCEKPMSAYDSLGPALVCYACDDEVVDLESF